MRASREIAFLLHAERERRASGGSTVGSTAGSRGAAESPHGRLDRLAEGAASEPIAVRVRREAALRRESPPIGAPAAAEILAMLAARPVLLPAPAEQPEAAVVEVVVIETCPDCGHGFTVDWLACPACGALAAAARPASDTLAADPPADEAMVTSRKPMNICPHCGAAFPRGKLACPECGSDAETGWKTQSEIDYESVELPETESASAHAGPIPRWLWLAAAIVLVIALAIFFMLR